MSVFMLIGIHMFAICTWLSIRLYPELPLIMMIAIQPLKQFLLETVPFFQTVDPMLILALWLGVLAVLNLPQALSHRRFYPKEILVAQGLFAGWVLLSLLWTSAPIYGTYKGLRLALLNTLLLYSPLLLVRDIASIKRLIQATIIFSLIVYTKIMIWPSYIVAPMAENKFFRAGFFYGNDTSPVALYLASTFCLGGIMAARSRLRAGIYLLCMVPLTFGGWMTGTRLSIGSIIVATICTILMFSRRGQSNRKGIVLVLSILSIVIMATIVSPVSQSERIIRVLSEKGLDESGLARLDHYRVGWTAFLENPIVGGGIGSYATFRGGGDDRWFPHNILLEVSIELGIIGLALFLFMLFGFIRHVLILRRRIGEIDLAGRQISDMFLVALVVTLFASQVTDDLADNRAIWLVMGLGLAAYHIVLEQIQNR